MANKTKNTPQCPEGSRWCPIQKKCVPVDQKKRQGQQQGRGQGQGPMGVPVKKVKETMKLVDEIFDEGFENYGKLKEAEKQLDLILDMCGKMHKEQEDDEEVDFGKGTTTGRPYDHPVKMRVRAGVAEGEGSAMGPVSQAGFVDSEYDEGPSKEDNPQKKQNVINTVPNQDIAKLYMTVRKQLEEVMKLSEEDKSEYKVFFNKMLNKFGVNSPTELSADKKKEFFNAVDKGWKGEKEVNEGVTHKQAMLDIIIKYGVKASQVYRVCMEKAKKEKWFSKNRSLAVAMCKQKDYLASAAGLKKYVGMCSKATNPEKCKKEVLSLAQQHMRKSEKYGRKAAQLKAKMIK